MGAESKLEASSTRFATSKGIWTRKFVSPANRSVPDRVFGWDKISLWIEFKAFGKLPTDAQQDEIEEMRARGLLATWVDNYDEAKTLLVWLKGGEAKCLELFCRDQNKF